MRTAVFAGSFDPFTIAHYDLVQRSLSLFDKIIIGIGVNSAKTGMMHYDDREKAIKLVFQPYSQVEVQQFTGLTVDFCAKVGAGYLLRGLRNTQDFEFENAIAQNNLSLAPSIETYFLMARSGLAHISSTIVRDIYKNNGDIQPFVPAEIVPYLK
ncbi:pantetheine-phosphate adenylyltransferase [Sphingobacterium griseoflavum]|uniref:Phosphopantetheine adenylyltransferase n=1 Tax=Sphingobacterium griseoflavum TaxID=1474952 RepID=A0ABQ3I055_9SPHI|nr:pantetheine-phosphate adenylyltransferase [Sphingobacterium griseoflavum]GHE41694.1 phosphopantetheine adenylyltransferase [Sphingobacterium griseoflavum]